MKEFINIVAIAKKHNAYLYWNNSYNNWVCHKTNIENRGLELIHKF